MAGVPPNSSPTIARPADRGELPADGFLRAIRVGHRRQVRLGVDAQVQRAESRGSQRVCAVGQRQCQRQIVLAYLHRFSSSLRPPQGGWYPHCIVAGAAHDAVLSRSYHGPVWEFGLLLLLMAVLAVFLVQRFVPRGPRGELLSGTLLVTGVSPRPDATGEQFVTIAGVINGPTVNEHAVYQRMAVDVESVADHRPAVPGGVFAEEPGQLEIRSRGTACATGAACATRSPGRPPAERPSTGRGRPRHHHHPRWLRLSTTPCSISGCRRNGVMMSTGRGNTTVEFWSAPSSKSVCR